MHRRTARTACAALLWCACGNSEPGAPGGPPGMGTDSGTDALTGTMLDGGAAPDAPADSDGGDSGASSGALYAAPNGGGTACTLEAPCTLEGAAAAVRTRNQALIADLVVILRGGTYGLAATFALGPPDSGSGGHQVVYQAYPGEVPILSGALRVTGFSVYDAGQNIWGAAVPAGSKGRQLFVNGARAQRARSPAAPPNVAVTSTGFTTSDGSYATFKSPTTMEIAQESDWKHLRCPLSDVSSAAGGSSLDVLPSCWASNSTNVPNLQYPFNGAGLPTLSGISWVENAYELLTQPGQFYLDVGASYLYYMPLPGEDMTTADVELPILETLVDVSGTPGHLAPVNDDDPGAAYAGQWTQLTGRGFGDINDDVHYSGNIGDSVTYTFVGAGLEVLGETNTDEGAFTAYVDGTQDTGQSFTESGPAREARQVVYSVQGLPKAMHTVQIVNSGGQDTVIDGFLVVPDPIAPAHDIAFEGLTFSYATWNLPTTVGYLDNQAGVLWDTSGPLPTPTRIPAAVQTHRSKNVSFRSDTFTHVGGAAIDLADGTQDASIVGCVIRDTSGGGVSVGEVNDFFQTETSLMTSGDTVSDNAISFVGRDYHDAVGIWAGHNRGLTLAHNDVGHTPYSGISLGWGWGWATTEGTIYAGNNQILDNYVHDVMGILNDGGPIYTLGGQGDGDGSATSVFSGNFVTVGNNTYNMLYQDEGSSYWDTYDNVTSLGGDYWIGMWIWTIEDITIGPVNFTDNPNVLNNGTNITFTQATVVTGGNWPAPALSIMAAAGLEPSYRAAIASPIVDDDDQSFAYVGSSWVGSGTRGFGDFDDNVHYTSNSGDAATVTFTGTAVTLVGEQADDQGMVEVFVDGQSAGMVDTSLPLASQNIPPSSDGVQRLAQQTLFTSAALPAGSHALQIVMRTGSAMTIDAVQVQSM